MAGRIRSDPARWGSIALVTIASAAFAAWLLFILTMASLIVARLSLPPTSWNGGNDSYLLLVSLVPVGGILLGHIARSRAALFGIGAVFLTISLMGVGAFMPMPQVSNPGRPAAGI